MKKSFLSAKTCMKMLFVARDCNISEKKNRKENFRVNKFD